MVVDQQHLHGRILKATSICARHRLGHADRLARALALHRDLDGQLRAASIGSYFEQLEAAAQPAAGRHRRREAHPVQAVVDAHARVERPRTPKRPSPAAATASGSRARWSCRTGPCARARDRRGSTGGRRWLRRTASMRSWVDARSSRCRRCPGRPAVAGRRGGRSFAFDSVRVQASTQSVIGSHCSRSRSKRLGATSHERQPVGGEVHVVLRVAQKAQHRHAHRLEEAAQLVGGDRALAGAHADHRRAGPCRCAGARAAGG